MNKYLELDGKQYLVLGLDESRYGISMALKDHDFFIPDKSQPITVQFSHWKEPVTLLVKQITYANDFFELKTFVSAVVVE